MSRSFLDRPEVGNFAVKADEHVAWGAQDASDILLVSRDRLLQNWRYTIGAMVRDAVHRERKRIAGRLRALRNRRLYAKKKA